MNINKLLKLVNIFYNKAFLAVPKDLRSLSTNNLTLKFGRGVADYPADLGIDKGYNDEYESYAEKYNKNIKEMISSLAYIINLISYDERWLDNVVTEWDILYGIKKSYEDAKHRFDQLWTNRVKEGGYTFENLEWALWPIFLDGGAADLHTLVRRGTPGNIESLDAFMNQEFEAVKKLVAKWTKKI